MAPTPEMRRYQPEQRKMQKIYLPQEERWPVVVAWNWSYAYTIFIPLGMIGTSVQAAVSASFACIGLFLK